LKTRSSGRIQLNTEPIDRAVITPLRCELARAISSMRGAEKAPIGARELKSSSVTPYEAEYTLWSSRAAR
jgi:hypothetical protein